jgi:hypothetical protein
MSVSRSRRSLSTTVSLPERFRHPAAQSSSARARLEYRLSTLFSTSRNRAMTASDASLFYIPLYPEALCEAQNATSGCSAGLELIEAAVSYVRGHYPYWTRTDGADHIVAVLNERAVLHPGTFQPSCVARKDHPPHTHDARSDIGKRRRCLLSTSGYCHSKYAIPIAHC